VHHRLHSRHEYISNSSLVDLLPKSSAHWIEDRNALVGVLRVHLPEHVEHVLIQVGTRSNEAAQPWYLDLVEAFEPERGLRLWIALRSAARWQGIGICEDKRTVRTAGVVLAEDQICERRNKLLTSDSHCSAHDLQRW
jgi:hypothetical protein